MKLFWLFLQLKVATQVTKITLVRNQPQLGASGLCDACKEFVAELKKEIDNPQTQVGSQSRLPLLPGYHFSWFCNIYEFYSVGFH